MQLASLITFIGGGCEAGRGRAGRRENKFVLVLNAACMHVVLRYVSLSHISVLLWRPLSIQKRLVGSRTLVYL